MVRIVRTPAGLNVDYSWVDTFDGIIDAHASDPKKSKSKKRKQDKPPKTTTQAEFVPKPVSAGKSITKKSN